VAITGLNRNPSPTDLRTFGRLLIPFVALFGAVVGWRAGSSGPAAAVWVVGGAVALVYLAAPAARRPVFLGWTYATYPIGWAISQVVLGIVYFGVLTPIGLILRRLGRDPLERGFDGTAPSYWVEREPEVPVARYFRQF
jgi:Saxitoxin biosynthesis operon protein SxtJ